MQHLFIGKRIKIIGDHPHKGETGIIDRIETTAFGQTGFIVKLEDCNHSTKECFIFNSEHFIFWDRR